MPSRNTVLAARRRRNGGSLLATVILGVCIVVGAIVVAQRMPTTVATIPAPVVAEFDTISVPVPIEPVPAGTRIRDVRMKQVNFPRHQVPAGSVIDLGSVADAVTITTLPAELPLFSKNLSSDAPGLNPVLERIPPGMRAMTVRVDATAAVEGWAGSGSIVDVLLIEKDRTTVVAERVKILSAERSVVPVEGQAAPNVPSTVTLLVTQDQCLSINTAIPRGRIAFALRGTRDEQTWHDPVFTAAQLNTLPSEEDRGEGSVTGFVTFADNGKTRSYALSKGRWVTTEIVPQGALIGDARARFDGSAVR